MAPALITFFSKWVLLFVTLWLAIWAARLVCCSTFTYSEHKADPAVQAFSDVYLSLVQECLWRY